MPHVVLDGKVQVKAIFDEINPLFIKDGGRILKTLDTYIDRENKAILIESLVVEEKNKANFFAMISSREDSIVVRIYPGSVVEKTDGVKRILAEIAKRLHNSFPQLKLGKTNISEFLD